MRLIIALTFALLITGCSSIPRKMGQIRPGMSRDEVTSILGQPESTGGTTTSEYLYYNPVVAFGTYELFMVEIQEGRVSRYGSLGRSGPSAGQIALMQNSINQQNQINQQNMNQFQSAVMRPQTAPINCTSNSIGGTTYTNCR